MAALNTLLLLLAALAIPGLINRTRALLAGRKGIRFAQHLYDVRLLLRKGAVYSPTTTAVFRAAPSVTLGTALVAALFVPVGDLPSALSFEGDLIAFAYLLALGRVALILAAMDTGSSFEGMGASREALYFIDYSVTFRYTSSRVWKSLPMITSSMFSAVTATGSIV